jgi:hypothetical protein
MDSAEPRHPRARYDAPVRRISTPLTDSEIAEIDDWGFARHIRDRSTALRQLIKAGLAASEGEQAHPQRRQRLAHKR